MTLRERLAANETVRPATNGQGALALHAYQELKKTMHQTILDRIDLEQALGAEVVHTVPNDYLAATDSVNQGIPLLQLSRTSAVARSLAELVELVTARRVTESRGLFDRLFSRSEA